MRICVVCDVLGQENNGTTIAGMNLIRSLKSKGHEVNIVCNDIEKNGVPGYYVVPEWKIPFLTKVIHKNGVKLSKIDKSVMIEALKNVDHVHFYYHLNYHNMQLSTVRKIIFLQRQAFMLKQKMLVAILD